MRNSFIVSAWERISSIDRSQELTLSIILFLGFVTRLAPLFLDEYPVDTPLNGGGLYYQFTAAILNNNFAYPTHIPYYTIGGIPFAYPPFVFYTVAVLAKLTPLSAYALHNNLPVLVSCLTLIAFYFLAKTVFDDSCRVLFATAVYAVLPMAFTDFFTGEGLIEASGTLITILGIISFYRLFDRRSPKYILVSGGLFALGTMSSPGAGLALAITLAVFAIFRNRHPSNLGYFVGVAAIGFVGSAPWWLTVIINHGFQVLLNGFTTRASSILILLKPVIYFQGQYTDVFSQSSFFWGGFLLLGVVICLVIREFLLPIWVVGFMIFNELRYIIPIPIILLITIGAFDVVLPGLRANINSTNILNEEFAPEGVDWDSVLVGLFLTLLVLHSIGIAALYTVHGEYGIHEADTDSVAAMHWIKAETPAESKFLVIHPYSESASWWLLDWFPVLTHRTTINTDYGSEWTGQYADIVDTNTALNNTTSRTELMKITNQRNLTYTHLYITRSQKTAPLIQNLQKTREMRVVFDNSRAIVFRRVNSTSKPKGG